MKDDTKRRLSDLILEELSEKIRTHESLRKKLEAFTDLPVEKVADAILNQFEYLLSSDLRDLIVLLIEREAAQESSPAAPAVEDQPPEREPESVPPPSAKQVILREEEPVPVSALPDESPHSIMEHFAVKEPFPTSPLDFQLQPDDWFYLYGISYAPDSTGKGIPTRKLKFKGIDGTNDVFMIDYGDVRLYVSKLNVTDYSLDKLGRPVLPTPKTSPYKLQHEFIGNVLRSEDTMIALPFWTILQGRDRIINRVEDYYVEILKVLIDLHDAEEWNVEVFVMDERISQLASTSESAKRRMPQRETKHPVAANKDLKLIEQVVIREKNIAQDFHNSILIHTTKAKVDHIIRLDNAVMDDWKSILAARYTVSKDRRKNFWQEIHNLQSKYESAELMIRVTIPNIHFSFV
ncbi:MAG TPA: GvpL/GvpF family gas vesicle protein [Bacteroidota bacterium]|nr:GvpL/GvpF family gas vesicle protein [Bacteroidota bacterium]